MSEEEKEKKIIFFKQSLTNQGLIVLRWIFPGRFSMLVFQQISAVLQKPAVSWHPTVQLSVCYSGRQAGLKLRSPRMKPPSRVSTSVTKVKESSCWTVKEQEEKLLGFRMLWADIDLWPLKSNPFTFKLKLRFLPNNVGYPGQMLQN